MPTKITSTAEVMPNSTKAPLLIAATPSVPTTPINFGVMPTNIMPRSKTSQHRVQIIMATNISVSFLKNTKSQSVSPLTLQATETIKELRKQDQSRLYRRMQYVFKLPFELLSLPYCAQDRRTPNKPFEEGWRCIVWTSSLDEYPPYKESKK